MLVQALMPGFYGYQRRRVGDEFEIKGPEEFSFIWMEPVHEGSWGVIKAYTDKSPRKKFYGMRYPEGTVACEDKGDQVGNGSKPELDPIPKCVKAIEPANQDKKPRRGERPNKETIKRKTSKKKVSKSSSADRTADQAVI